jgi:putative sigma-54 modulation protein
MELQFYGKNLTITDSIAEYARKKTEKLSRYFSRIDESKVEISREKTRSPKDRFTVQITLRSKGNILRAEEKASSVNLAIDLAADSLVHQISRFKGKFARKGKGEPGGAAEELAMAKPVKMPKIARVKRFAIRSMSTKEAAEQMEMLNHDFFMFVNEDSEAINLLYRRKDGNFGLIEAEVEDA